MSEKDLAKQLERLKEELKKPPEVVYQQPEGEEMSVKKKVVKKATKKVAKASPTSNVDVVTLADLAKEASVTPQRIRQKLRAAKVKRDGRWEWAKGSKELKDVRKALDLPA